MVFPLSTPAAWATIIGLVAATVSATGPGTSAKPSRMDKPAVGVRYHTASVDGRMIFYREAGESKQSTIVLLHGFPSSSHMYRELIPALADHFHVIAPDYIGFGYSEAPSAREFAYTFDNLTRYVTGLIDQLGLTSYVLYMQDYGGPIGFRIAASRPDAIKGLVIQNANAYLEGIGDMPKKVFLPLWEKRDAASEAAASALLTPEATKFQYTAGAKSAESLNPDAWTFDQALLDRPGTRDYQLDLLENYKTNVAAYEAWHSAFRMNRPKTLILWGKNDPIFIAPGAEAYKRDLPDAKLVWLEGGHFALEENVSDVAREIEAMFSGR
jgi:pimeloyl-ACP methyl ester carboxylesterase